MFVGYARLSTDDQNRNSQRDARQLAGYEKIVEDPLPDFRLYEPKDAKEVWATALNKDKQALAVQLCDERKQTLVQMCELMAVSRPTFYKYSDAVKSNACGNM